MDHDKYKKIRQFQNEVLKNVTHVPKYIKKRILHRYPQIQTATQEIRFAPKHEDKLHHLINIEAIQVLDNSETVGRTKRKI